jgi:hypothetical protein
MEKRNAAEAKSMFDFTNGFSKPLFNSFATQISFLSSEQRTMVMLHFWEALTYLVCEDMESSADDQTEVTALQKRLEYILGDTGHIEIPDIDLSDEEE